VDVRPGRAGTPQPASSSSRLRPRIEQIADGLLDSLTGRAEFDVVRALPVRTTPR
jgi:hypothetical protein